MSNTWFEKFRNSLFQGGRESRHYDMTPRRSTNFAIEPRRTELFLMW